jgi:hypothetical protein
MGSRAGLAVRVVDRSRLSPKSMEEKRVLGPKSRSPPKDSCLAEREDVSE